MGEKRKPHVYIDPRYVTEDTPDLFEERDDLVAKLRADLAQARKELADADAMLRSSYWHNAWRGEKARADMLEHSTRYTLERVSALTAERDALHVENETLRAAIGTPEVYAGVVAEVVEAELEQARKEAERLRKELASERSAADGVRIQRDELLRQRDEALEKLEADCRGCTDVADLTARLADAEVGRLAAIRAYATAERPSIPKCLDPGHDDRWCSHCDSMMDGVGHAQETVLRILDGDVNL